MTTTKEEREEAAMMREHDSSETSGTLAGLPDVDIHLDAVQKYVLIQAQTRYFVRGDEHASYHKDVARPLTTELRRRGITYRVLGGGRIEHNSGAGTIKIYGFSYGFPWVDGESKHHIAADVLRRTFGNTFKVEWTDEGY